MKRKKLKCKLICHKNADHLQQIFTGFASLAKKGVIDLKLETHKEKYTEHSLKQHLFVILNDEGKLFYDTHDSFEIDTTIINDVDFYFKRSYLSSYISKLGEKGKKIKPLGLNYLLYPDFYDWNGFRRCFSFGNYGQALKMLKMNGSFFSTSTNLESSPKVNFSPKVLFMVRTYDPYDDPDRPRNKVEERMAINEMRAKCIQLLSDEFGKQFYGGFSHTGLAIKQYKRHLLPDNNVASKESYIALLKNYPICVATTGLHGSIGWKFAEYVALSKAIVTEKLAYEVPGDLEKEKNYLEFSSAEECVNQVSSLFTNHELRKQIMENNQKYYQSFVKPDAMILNTLNIALSH